MKFLGMKFLGGDNVLRSFDNHLEYLERCAKAWEAQRNPKQAEWVRKMARQLIAEYGEKKLSMISKKHWQTALDVQTACNLSAVVFAFGEAMKAVNDEARELGKGTDWRNKHPISVLFATQIAHLTRVCSLAEDSVYSAAYQAALDAVKKDQ